MLWGLAPRVASAPGTEQQDPASLAVGSSRLILTNSVNEIVVVCCILTIRKIKILSTYVTN